MSEMNAKYKQIIQDLEDNIKEKKTLEFVKEKFAEVSLLFVDMIDRVTRLTDNKIQEIESKQQEISNRISSVQKIVDGIENDIYEGDDSYEFEIVCPYCNYEFTADVEDEEKEELLCPECHNTIELDWNFDEELIGGCGSGCSHCSSGCVAEDGVGYDLEEDKDNKNKEDEDM